MSNEDIARELLTARSYVVLSTADADGVPWATPVWFASDDFSELFWVSDPGSRHSTNIAVRPQIAMVVFDSTVAPGTGQGVYMTATAGPVTDPAELEHAMAVFSRRGERDGIGEWNLERVTGPARLRLYRARVSEHWILDPDSPRDERVAVRPGRGATPPRPRAGRPGGPGS